MEMRFSGPKILSTFAIVVIAGLAMIGAIGVHLFVTPKTGIAYAQDPALVGSISRVTASTPNLTLAAADTVVLSINVYGRQDVEDSSLASDVDIDWSASAGTLPDDADGTSVSYTAPSEPGTYTVTASPSSECIGTTSECTATFRITVRRQGEASAPSAPPRNPDGGIPSVLTDPDGGQYEVFTPEDGGTFTGDGFWIDAPVGIVPNDEIIGVSMSEQDAASNAGMTEHRYTLSGRQYAISAVDASGDRLASYRLDGPAQVCIPVPAELRPNITSVGLVVINEEGTLTALTTWIRVTPSLIVCGNLSVVPAVVAASIPGSPPPLPTATPEPAPSLPVTGGNAPTSSSTFGWLLLAGLTLIALAAIGMSTRRMRSHRRFGTRY